jgi:serine/threonine-protein kinase
MHCPSCQSENDDAAEACFTCGFLFVSVVRRGAVLASRYEILRPLGRGGMGAVYEAHDRVLDETVALKVLRPDIARSEELTLRFRSEIKLARRVRHPNVCAIHEYGEDGALRFISMELVDGVDLKRVLRGRGALPPAEAIDVGIQAARGLAAIHAAGIVQDLKTPT